MVPNSMSGPNEKDKGLKALTNIHTRIHCAATDEPEPDTESREELNELDITNLLDILVEIALAVARRRQGQDR